MDLLAMNLTVAMRNDAYGNADKDAHIGRGCVQEGGQSQAELS